MTFHGEWVKPYDKDCPLNDHQHYLVDTIQTALARVTDSVEKLNGTRLHISRPVWEQGKLDEIQDDWLLLEIKKYSSHGPIGMVLLPYDEEPRIIITDRISQHQTGNGWTRPMSTKSIYTLKEVADILWTAPEILL